MSSQVRNPTSYRVDHPYAQRYAKAFQKSYSRHVPGSDSTKIYNKAYTIACTFVTTNAEYLAIDPTQAGTADGSTDGANAGAITRTTIEYATVATVYHVPVPAHAAADATVYHATEATEDTEDDYNCAEIDAIIDAELNYVEQSYVDEDLAVAAAQATIDKAHKQPISQTVRETWIPSCRNCDKCNGYPLDVGDGDEIVVCNKCATGCVSCRQRAVEMLQEGLVGVNVMCKECGTNTACVADAIKVTKDIKAGNVV